MEEEHHSSMMVKDEAGEYEFAAFDPTKKKKKKQQRRRLEEDQVEEGFLDEQGSNPNIYESQSDYEYYELLERMVDLIHEKNPEFGGRRRAVLTPPVVKADGTRKSIWVNFIPICKQMHRQPDHVMRFFLAELGTTGSLDGQQRLVFKYKFKSEMVFVVEKILKKYAKDYVMCNACNSMDTLLSKEERLNFLRCEKCGSVRTVQRIEFGFNANAARERRRAAP